MACTKKTYATQEEADIVAAICHQTTYLCPKCKQYHTTSNGRFAIFKARGYPDVAAEWIKRHTRRRRHKSKSED